MNSNILQELDRLEEELGIHILFACESGSRAWGFASPDSDYDVRVIYIHSMEWYLSLIQEKDTFSWFSEDRELDFTGWELKKVLKNIHKSNCTVYEWLNSPIVYKNVEGLREELLSLAPDYFNPKGSMHHYLNIAYCYQKSVLVEEGEVSLKKYFYVLRPLMGAMWIAKHRTPPPMEVDHLINEVLEDPEIVSIVNELLTLKRAENEIGKVSPHPILNAFIRESLEYFEEFSQHIDGKKGKLRYLDPIFFNRLFSQSFKSSPPATQ